MAFAHIRRATVALSLAASVMTACADGPRLPQASNPMPPRSSTPTMAPSAAVAPGPRYVAMGDSAASAPLVPDQANPAGCFRSTNDYPAVLARRINATSFTDVTCSGARTENLTSRAQSTRTGEVPPQLDAVTSDTELVTITIGGNDIDLPANAAKCRRTALDGPPCSADFVVDGVDSISQAIEADADDWSALIDAVREKAPGARVVVVGYGTYVQPGGCFPAEPITPDDATYFQGKLDELDDRLAQVANQEGVEFFDPGPLTIGHDICAAPQDRYFEGFVPVHPALPLHPNGMGANAFGTALADVVTS